MGQKVPAASAHKEMTNNFFTTYFMALNVAALGRQDDVGEVLVVEEPGEDPQHVALVVVPLEAVLLPGGGDSSRTSHRLHHHRSPLRAARAESEKAARKSRRKRQMST